LLAEIKASYKGHHVKCSTCLEKKVQKDKTNKILKVALPEINFIIAQWNLEKNVNN
jgi:hypothetical protein